MFHSAVGEVGRSNGGRVSSHAMPKTHHPTSHYQALCKLARYHEECSPAHLKLLPTHVYVVAVGICTTHTYVCLKLCMIYGIFCRSPNCGPDEASLIISGMNHVQLYAYQCETHVHNVCALKNSAAFESHCFSD